MPYSPNNSVKYNFALFCKTYIKDLDRIKILKASVDQFNADRIPFFIVCPATDFETITNGLITKKENYPLHFITDEEVLEKNDLPNLKQSWFNQQIIKLGFYKLNLCNHYSIFDSDCYFIQDFYISDFMFDENTPYFCMSEILRPTEELMFVKNYIQRQGRFYHTGYISQVFSKIVLEDMEKNLLKKRNQTFIDLIKLHPYEMNWYGEWFLKSNIIPLKLTHGKVYGITTMLGYYWTRKRGTTLKDIINGGYIALVMQNKWVPDKEYKPHPFYKFIKMRDIFIDEYYRYRGENTNLFKKIELFIRRVRDCIKLLVRGCGKIK